MRSVLLAVTVAVAGVAPSAGAGWVTVRDPASPLAPVPVGTFLLDAGALSADGLGWRSIAAPPGLRLQRLVPAAGGLVAHALHCDPTCRYAVLAHSGDGFRWKEAEALPTSPTAPVVLACGSGCLAVAGALPLTSAEGRVWTRHPEAVPVLSEVQVHGVVWSGTAWIAVGEEGGSGRGWIGRTADGAAWSAETVPEPLLAVASGPGRLVAVGAATAAVSTDGGSSWILVPFPGEGRAVAWDGQRYVAAAVSPAEGGATVLVSSRGREWSRAGGPFPGLDPAAVAVTPQGVLVTGRNGLAWRLEDGSWEARTRGAADPATVTAAVQVGDGLWVFAAGTPAGPVGAGAGVVGRSEDGLTWTWTAEEGAPSRVLAAASDGTRVVAATPGGRGGPGLALRPPGGDWISVAVPGLPGEIRDVAWGPPGFVAVASAPGAVAWSADGSSWTPLTVSGVAGTGGAVAWYAGRFVAAWGRDIATSPDGTTWTAAPGVLPLALGEGSLLVATPDWLLALDRSGRAARSADGTLWSPVPGPGTLAGGGGVAVADAAWTGTEVVAVGAGGLLARSADGLTWRAEEAPVPGDFVAVGTAGGRPVVLSERAAVLVDAGEGPVPVRWRRAVPAVAQTPGLEDTFWRSELWLANPGDAHAVAWLELRTGAISGPQRRELSIPPHAAVTLPDTVGELGGARIGALWLQADAPLVASSRTWTPSPAGSFGQVLPAVSPAPNEAVLPGLRATDGFRTNLGVAAGEDGAVVTLQLHAPDGSILATETVSLGRWGMLQRVRAAHGAPLAWASVRADRPVAVYASVVDDATGDAVTVLPATVTEAPLVVPAAAHTPGIGGTFWRTDLDLVAPGPEPARVRIELLPPGGGGVPAADTVTVPARGAVRLADVLGTLFPGYAVGALRVVPLEGAVAAASRTFTPGEGGSYGQTVPAVPESAALGWGETGILVGLRGGPAVEAWFRTNLGLVNVGDVPAEVEIAVRRGSGEALATIRATVPARGYTQLVRALANARWAVGDGWAAVRPLTAGARILAWGSVVDGASGDPTLVTAERATP